MEMTVLQRVNYIIDNFGKTKNYFANEIGMSSTTVWRQLKGEQALSSKLIEGVLTAYPEVSAEWLLRGTGDIRLENDASIAETQNNNKADSVWKAKYDELEKRYDQLLSILGGGIRKANVG